jgi:hypothetical protein
MTCTPIFLTGIHPKQERGRKEIRDRPEEDGKIKKRLTSVGQHLAKIQSQIVATLIFFVEYVLSFEPLLWLLVLFFSSSRGASSPNDWVKPAPERGAFL